MEAQNAKIRADIKRPGLGPTVVGQRTQFDIHLWESLPAEQVWAYATLESKEAVFSASSKGKDHFTISYTPTRPGNYTLAIDLLARGPQYPVLTERYSGVLVTGKRDAGQAVTSQGN